MKMLTKIVIADFIILAIMVFPARAGKFDGWKSYTSSAQIRYMDYFDDSLQVISSGGWLKIDSETRGKVKFTNSEGLGTNNLHYIIKDSAGPVWVAGYGRLVKYEDGVFRPYLFFDRDGNLLTLYTIADDGDQLWIGTSKGLALFSKEKDDGQIEDFYSRFGDLNADAAVYDIVLLGDTIWLATSDGLAIADKSVPNMLKSYLNWMTMKPSYFVPGSLDTVNALAYFKGEIYLGTTRDAFRLEVNGEDTSFVDINTRSVVNVKHMIIERDSLIIYAGGGFFAHGDPSGQSATWNYTPTVYPYTFSSGRVVDTLKWLGNYLSGLYYGSDTLFFSFDDGGLPGNLVTSLSSDIDGNVAGGFNIDGLAIFDGDGWETHLFDQIGHGVRTLVHDVLGGIWAGTWGRGLSLIRGDSITTFNESNSDLHGVPDAPDYVVVNRVAADDHYVFMSNFAPRDGNPVRVVDVYGTAGWQSFGVDDGLSITLLNSIDCHSGVFVVGTEDNGIFYYYYGPDPFDKSDDSIINLRESNSWLNSDNIRTVKFDDKGILWVGTRYGLSRYDPGIDRFINVSLPIGFGPEVTQLEFDKRGNMWMGSQNGLARYDAGTGSIQVFTTLNSGLSDDRITALLINPTTNDLWVGTSEGISVFESTIGPPAARVEDVIAFPNPFIIRSSSDILSFNYSGEAFVRIYTINGELVREADINIPWDGKNQRGADVAPGPYLFLLTAEDGSVGRGKILLIRE